MGFSETEKMEQKLAMNSAAAENGVIYNGSTKHAGGVDSLKLAHFPYGLYNNKKEILASIFITVSLVLNVILIVFICSRSSDALSGTSCEILPTEYCPDGWIGYQRKCYYFSDSYRTWNHSQNYCASFNASLVVIDSKEEMSFLRRYKGSADHWIGLQKMNDQEPWRWIDGTIFDNWFVIRGGGECAYVNYHGVASSSGRSEEPWICSKPIKR